MSQEFRFNFQGATEKSGRDGSQKNVPYEGSNVRNLAFEWLDGRKKFLNYAYLITGGYSPDDNIITLVFTTDTVLIKGHNLDLLFDELLHHIPKSLSCVEERYNQISDAQYTVNQVQITKV